MSGSFERPTIEIVERGHRSAHRALAAVATLLAVGALYGSAGLITGFLTLGEPATQRLPFGSPVVGGIALAVVVALPTTATATLLWRPHPDALRAAAWCGGLLIARLAVEVAFIRQFSPLQVVCGGAGLLLLAAGRRHTSAVPG